MNPELPFVALLAFLPAGLANMAPVFASRWRQLDWLNVPVDLGRSFRGKRIFGDNKTVRGFVAGFGFALIGVLIQRIFDHWACLSCAGYLRAFSSVNPFILAALYSFGALAGDSVESFFKRQVGIKPGSSWFPFDQSDYIVGGLLATWPVLHYSGQLVAAIFVIMFGVHILSTFIAHRLGLKDAPL